MYFQFFSLITNQQNAKEILIYGDQITYDQKNNIIAKGKAKVLYENQIISSNLIIYSQKTGDITLPIEFSLKDERNNYYYGSNGTFNSDFKFGNINEHLKARIEIKHPSLNYDLIRNGSIGLAESYMQGYFETDNLSNLIEITAKNIKLIYKFSGILDFSAINFLKNKIIKNTKKRSKENIAKHYDLGNNFFLYGLMKL